MWRHQDRAILSAKQRIYDSRAQLSFEVVSGSTVLPLAQLARPPSPVPSFAITTYSVVLTTYLYCAPSQAEAVIQTANAIMQLPSFGTMATQLDRIASLLR